MTTLDRTAAPPWCWRGYFDQPPLIPALAATLDAMAPGSLPEFRLPVTLGDAAMVVLAAVAVAVSAVPISSHWLATYTLDRCGGR